MNTGAFPPEAQYGTLEFWKARCKKVEEANAELRDILEWLVDLQNGPPLLKYEEVWNNTMDRAAKALGRKS